VLRERSIVRAHSCARFVERQMVKLSLIVMFVLSLATLSVAASAIPDASAPVQIADSGL